MPLFPHRRLWCAEAENLTIKRVQRLWKYGRKRKRSLAKKLTFSLGRRQKEFQLLQGLEIP